MLFKKAQVLPTAFLVDLLKPIATGMTSYRGKLFVPQSLYFQPFFFHAGEEVLDPEVGSWEDMPAGMASKAGRNQVEHHCGRTLHPNTSSSFDSAKMKVYDHQDDAWKVVAEDVPVSDFADPETPCLLAGLVGSSTKSQRMAGAVSA